ncbi:MAG: SpoIIE family protein phosphatase [Cytophagales bacterium]|nr:SpoIIE family protein phosphatase [Cytophagales bacterium]
MEKRVLKFDKYIARICLILSILSWLAMMASHQIVIFGLRSSTPSGIPPYTPDLFLIGYTLLVYGFFRTKLLKAETLNVIELLWRVFVTGLITTIISLLLELAASFWEGIASNPFIAMVIYDLNTGLILCFLLSTFAVLKKLVLYQKSKNLLRTWRFFEGTLLFALGLVLFNLEPFGASFNLLLGLLVVLSLVLAGNLKWVAYLDFKEKWRSILLLLLSLVYQLYFVGYLIGIPFEHLGTRPTDLLSQSIFIGLFAFCLSYSLFALLVILFNLPTTSVFEKKFEEAMNFSKLSQSKHAGRSEEEIMDLLLHSAVSAVLANAAWIDMHNEEGDIVRSIGHELSEKEIEEARKQLAANPVLREWTTLKDIKKQKTSFTLQAFDFGPYRSLLLFPLFVQERRYGTLCLLKDVSEGFNTNMIDIARTFINQACVSVENHLLLEETLDNERYKEEIKIAKRVQEELLPKKLDKNSDTSIACYTKASAQIGGDFYDSFSLDEHRMVLTIGDVSGKGVSAAFHMAEMKGVFQSLSQLNLTPEKFLVHANQALSRCLDDRSFITLSYFLIDSRKKTIQFARAGHCPALFYESSKKSVLELHGKGMGLGLVRDESYSKHVEVTELAYKPGDMLFLYTDGISEARNPAKEEFGVESIKSNMINHVSEKTEIILSRIIESARGFCENQLPDDDCTAVLVKFQENRLQEKPVS